jgi:hypothetical protein
MIWRKKLLGLWSAGVLLSAVVMRGILGGEGQCFG